MAKKTHEEMFNILARKRNGHQNHITRTQTATNVGKDVGKKKPSYTAGGNVN
jgi:hypothetical protein